MKENTRASLLHGAGSVTALLSAAFLLAGFIHLYFLCDSFGIDVGHYFLLGDYVACSIEQIYHAVWGVVGVAIGYFFGDASAQSMRPIENSSSLRCILWPLFVPLLFSAAYLVVCWQDYFFEIGYLTYPTSTTLSIVVFGGMVICILGLKFPRMTGPIVPIILALLFFLTSLLVNTFKIVEEIKEGTHTDRFTVKVANTTFTEKQSQIIGSNSRYMFLYLRDETTMIIPLNQISSVSIGAS